MDVEQNQIDPQIKDYLKQRFPYLQPFQIDQKFKPKKKAIKELIPQETFYSEMGGEISKYSRALLGGTAEFLYYVPNILKDVIRQCVLKSKNGKISYSLKKAKELTQVGSQERRIVTKILRVLQSAKYVSNFKPHTVQTQYLNARKDLNEAKSINIQGKINTLIKKMRKYQTTDLNNIQVRTLQGAREGNQKAMNSLAQKIGYGFETLGFTPTEAQTVEYAGIQKKLANVVSQLKQNNAEQLGQAQFAQFKAEQMGFNNAKQNNE